jgi:hypothetical protein
LAEKLGKTPIKTVKKELQILKVLGKSEKPLSSRDIEKKILGPEKVNKKKRDPEIYRVIKDKLCIQKFNYGFFLFDWYKLLSSIDETETTSKKRIHGRIIMNLNRIGLDLIDYDYNRVKIAKEDYDSILTITAPRRSNTAISRSIKIQKDSKKDYATLTIFDDDEKRQRMPTYLIIKNVGKKEQVFYEGFQGNPAKVGTSYLNTSLNEKASKQVQEIKSKYPDLFNCTDEVKKIPIPNLDTTAIISAVSEIESNTRNLEYSMNIRGLIQYVLGMINEEGIGRARNIEISKVLQNLSENYKKEFPFLKHYKEIKELYDELAEREEYKHFQVKLVKQVAQELQYSLDTIDKEDLNYHMIKRYSEALTWYYMAPLKMSVLPLPEVIREYYVYTQEFIRNYLEKELQDTKSRIEYMFPISY